MTNLTTNTNLTSKTALVTIINEYFEDKVVTYNKRLHDMLVTETGVKFFPLLKDERNIVFVVEYEHFVKNVEKFTNREDKVYFVAHINDLAYIFTNDKDFVSLDFQQYGIDPNTIYVKYTPTYFNLLGGDVKYKKETLSAPNLTILNSYINEYSETYKYKVTVFHVQHFVDFFNLAYHLKNVRKNKDEMYDTLSIIAYCLDGYVLKLYEKL